MGCLFCDIISGKIPSTKIFENETVFAFEDITPKAPVHVLVIPKKHIEKIDYLKSDDKSLIGDMFLAVTEVAKIKNIASNGYRLIINNGPAGGQVIWHLHAHVLGGRDEMGPMLSI
jgi:histidine triad (HIT) family protein